VENYNGVIPTKEGIAPPAPTPPPSTLGGVDEVRPAVTVVGGDEDVADRLEAAGFEVVAAPSLSDVGGGDEERRSVAVVATGELRHVALGELGVPVVAVVDDHPDAIDDALRRGAHDVVRRPVVTPELVARVRSAERLSAAWRARDAAARTDALTGLYNRRHLDEHLDMLASMARRQRLPISLLIVDIDRTRRVNEELGNAAGDRVVAAVARRLTSSLRNEDVAGRWSGEEFLVMLPHTPLDGAWRLADRIRASVCDEPVLLGLADAHDVLVTVSIGCAEGYGDDVEDQLRRAHAALDDAKAAGRNRVVAAASAL
jgi:two-component system cell cycle response regulator